MRQTDTGIELSIRLTPKAAHDRVDGLRQLDDGRVCIAARVRAVPEDGKANAALERLIAGWLDVPKGAVSIISGQTSRMKVLRIEGDSEALGAAVARLTGKS